MLLTPFLTDFQEKEKSLIIFSQNDALRFQAAFKCHASKNIIHDKEGIRIICFW